MEAMSIDFKNEALNLVVLLENATGAVFENEKLAIDIVEETLKYKNSKIMDLKDIVTKNKEQFLEAEIKWFHFRSMKKFKSVMEEDVRACKNCGVLYWEGCLKRCKCE